MCTRVGGVHEAMREGVDGLLVPAASPVALAEALCRLLADDALRARCAANAVEGARRFDIGVAVERIEAIYDEVLARR